MYVRFLHDISISLTYSPDIICFSLNTNLNISFRGYIIFNIPRLNSSRGGAGILISLSINCQLICFDHINTLALENNVDIISVKILIKDFSPIISVSLYSPPCFSNFYTDANFWQKFFLFFHF